MAKQVDTTYGEALFELAKEEGHEVIYISTGEEGLYEKYGYTYWQDMTDWNGGTSRVYRRFVK